ncbi:type 1 fimbrial protein [Serratia symbiotica]|uniref:fimbrial protein n=1 Tax=Serratia symbiotica TaxID=138074 RepID=UPI001DBB34AF|nr:fimbrial protein [Serratia symbiotica]NIG87617.1 type 1 fimbrial protein [Serratia symbiotica]USS96374.1 type 1 fimbrial protein [Serratia symbiotica]
MQTLCCVLLAMLLLTVTGAQAVDIRLHGELVEGPCVVNINYADQRVVFGVMSAHDFYSRPRGHVKKFDILLEHCDLSFGNTVEITFDGEEDPQQPGLLAISGSAQGVAIGLETQQGEVLSLNRDMARFNLLPGDTRLSLQAYYRRIRAALSSDPLRKEPSAPLPPSR